MMPGYQGWSGPWCGSYFTAREGLVIYVGEQIFGAKWRNWKMLTEEFADGRGTDNILSYGVPHFINLYEDPQESYPITYRTPQNLWVRYPMSELLVKHAQSLKSEPPIQPGTTDPYLPAER